LLPSFGGIATSISYPTATSHRPITPQARQEAGISDGLLRLSVGIEAVEDLWAELDNALK